MSKKIEEETPELVADESAAEIERLRKLPEQLKLREIRLAELERENQIVKSERDNLAENLRKLSVAATRRDCGAIEIIGKSLGLWK